MQGYTHFCLYLSNSNLKLQPSFQYEERPSQADHLNSIGEIIVTSLRTAHGKRLCQMLMRSIQTAKEEPILLRRPAFHYQKAELTAKSSSKTSGKHKDIIA
ncbi:hypothetical protein OIU79_022364 [Salix purpurea]|uniref:Uncharacterized protein n=1 Tax=Salix purpurea TaxID=77065 RepID=A0A9Q0WIR3_SALPP|nr:hypothetical protein OIU79_022364 [Salix purpurea]